MDFLLWIQEYIRCDILDNIFLFITHLGDAGFIWIAVSIICLFFKKTRKAGVVSLIALLCSLVVNNFFLKNIIARTRPYDAVSELICIVERHSDYSFPSGHSASSFAAGVTFFRFLPKAYGIPTIILAGLISFSRLYVGVHYPTDVIAGVLSGILMSFIAAWIYVKMSFRPNKQAIR